MNGSVSPLDRVFRCPAAWPSPRRATLVAKILVALVCVAAAPAGAATLRVAPSGQDVATCGSALSPCRSIQYAINQIATQGTVLVAGSPAGLKYFYDPAADVCSPPLGTTGVVCVVNKQIELRGGFSQSDWSTSDPATNRTIIDGQGTRRGILAISTGPLTTLALEGFTIQNGRGTGIPARPGVDGFYAFGGGLLVELVDQLVVRDVAFRKNVAQGDSVPTEFGGAGSGGGVALRIVEAASLARVWFEDNAALGGVGAVRGGYAHGAGLYAFESNVTGSDLVFRRNRSIGGSSTGDGMNANGERADGFGGAINLQHGSMAELTGVSAVENTAMGGDAQVHAGGGFGGAIKMEQASLTLHDADLRGNVAEGGSAQNGWLGNGGGIETIHSELVVDRTRLVGNIARGGAGSTGATGAAGGGGINVTWVTPGMPSTFSMTNSIVADNAVEQGAGTTVTGGGGGGLWIQATDATIRHSTIARNRVDASMQGEALLLIESPVGSPTARGATATLAHSIIAEHTGFPEWQMAALHVKPGNSATIQGGLFANSVRETNAGDVPAAAGSIAEFASALVTSTPGFVAPGPPLFDYHLVASSQGRDLAPTSTTAVDIDGEARSTLAPRDAGADEFSAAGSISGTARDAGATPAPDVLVEVFDAETRALVGSAMTQGDGTYEVGGIAPGLHLVRFADAGATKRFMTEWHAEPADERTATVVGVSAGLETGGIDVTLAAAPLCFGRAPTIAGTRGWDVLVGTDGPDVVVGGAGNDEIDGAGGHDFVCGGLGNDVITGGRDDDRLSGGGGHDVLRGEAGDDVLRGAAGKDSLSGGTGNDDLRDVKGKNRLDGGSGTDACQARASDDVASCEAP